MMMKKSHYSLSLKVDLQVRLVESWFLNCFSWWLDFDSIRKIYSLSVYQTNKCETCNCKFSYSREPKDFAYIDCVNDSAVSKNDFRFELTLLGTWIDLTCKHSDDVWLELTCYVIYLNSLVTHAKRALEKELWKVLLLLAPLVLLTAASGSTY